MLFSQPSLHAIVQTMINYMVVVGFKKDVAQALIMTSIVVMDTVWSDGPSRWHDTDKDSFDSVVERTKNDIQTVVKRMLIDQCSNLCGCIVMGESPKEHMGPWLESMPKPFIVTYGAHPQNIFLMWYDSKQRVELLHSIASLLKRVGVPSPPDPFCSSFQHLCFPISLRKEWEGMSTEQRNLLSDSDKTKMKHIETFWNIGSADDGHVSCNF